MATLLEQDETPSVESIPNGVCETISIGGHAFPTIALSRGLYAIVDWKNYAWLMKWKWCVLVNRKTGRCYAVRLIRESGKNRTVFMHREILGLPRFDRTVIGDHKNNEMSLDNRECNLRSCTKRENEYNMGLRSHSTSGYKGVSWYKARSQWVSYITANGRRYSLGYFPPEAKEEAARAYDRAAVRLHGEFASLNFPIERGASGAY